MQRQNGRNPRQICGVGCNLTPVPLRGPGYRLFVGWPGGRATRPRRRGRAGVDCPRGSLEETATRRPTARPPFPPIAVGSKLSRPRPILAEGGLSALGGRHAGADVSLGTAGGQGCQGLVPRNKQSSVCVHEPVTPWHPPLRGRSRRQSVTPVLLAKAQAVQTDVHKHRSHRHCHVGRKRGRHCHRSDRTQSVIPRFGYTSPVAKSERRSRGSAGNRMLPSGDAVGGNDHR